MEKYNLMKSQISETGFGYVHGIYSGEEIENILSAISSADVSSSMFRKSKDLFAVRQCLKEIPLLPELVFNSRMKELVYSIFGDDFFVVKSIYFDKPLESNWFVSYHQDLTIAVDRKHDVEGYGPWTIKQDKYAVQPPLEMLENIFTVRIHLDDTDENNGALYVIPGSHSKGILRSGEIEKKEEVICSVPAGSVMIMKPLLWHSSKRSVGNHKRRVIHIEFANKELPGEIQWVERLNMTL